MKKQLPDHQEGLLEYLSAPAEKANEDLILKYFRKIFGDQFTRQKEAERSDGYLPGHFVLELKGKTSDWLSGLFQGIAYKKTLNFSVVIVAANEFLGVWSIKDLAPELVEEVLSEKGAPNSIGKRLAKKYKQQAKKLQKKACYLFPVELLDELFRLQTDVIAKEINSFEKTVKSQRKVRQKITVRNFTTILKQMTAFFDAKVPIKTVRAFYSMIFGWDDSSVLEISAKKPDQATLNGEVIEFLIPGKRLQFKEFVESHFVSLGDNENVDDFFAKYDQALDAVDPEFRIKHGIFFTDLDLSKFVMWYVKDHLGDIGKNYLVIDPACGSGNLVTNWRSPLELRHKVVSEIEPELLYTVEQRMKGDKWHNGKFTVVPKVSESKGLNFLDKSAEEYVETIREYLVEKGERADKPIAFLCNPPYRSDDDQAADSVKYDIHPSILELTGTDGSAERYCCFLAQMKLICEKAKESGLPGDSLLLLFTKAAWLTRRPIFQAIRENICASFEDVGGMIVNSREFFDVKGRFPIAFTVWRYRGANSGLDANRAIPLLDLTWMKKSALAEIEWSDQKSVETSCTKLVSSDNAKRVYFGQDIQNIKAWSGLTRYDFQREKRKAEKKDADFRCGLPNGDRRHSRKKTLGECDGEFLGFMDDLTPCRIKKDPRGLPWFRLNNQFMDCRKTRCFSGPPDKYAYAATDEATAKKVFVWFALGRVFASHGYPMWVDADEMWTVVAPPRLEQRLTKFAYAIGFAENECVENVFPARNPVETAPEIRSSNPMTPLDDNSYWNKHMAQFFRASGDDPEDKLVASVKAVFKIWRKRVSAERQIFVDYKRAYFVGDGELTEGAGLLQIRDYAKETNDEELNKAFEKVAAALKATKDEFNKLLHQKTGFNYFEIDARYLESQEAVEEAPEEQESNRKRAPRFTDVVEMRLALSGKVFSVLDKSKDFNRVKFAKAFYLADMVSGVDLQTEYFREAAGPLDQRSLYNEKVGIEPLAANNDFFVSEKKKGKSFDFVVYQAGKNLPIALRKFESSFEKSKDRIEDVLKLLKPMSRNQIEIVATLYACWNDLLIARRKPTDATIVKEFRDRWHPGKTAKFEAKGRGKPVFAEEQLIAALKWMREKNLVPTGKGKKTKIKPQREEIPF